MRLIMQNIGRAVMSHIQKRPRNPHFSRIFLGFYPQLRDVDVFWLQVR
jgi:hypothetical protein